MAFQKIDRAFVTDDKPLSAGLVQDIANQALAAREDVLPAATAVWDSRNAPRLVGLERIAVPFILRLPPGCNGIKVRVRGKADGTLGGTLGAVVVPIDWRAPLPDDSITQAVSSATEATTTVGTINTRADLNGAGALAFLCLTFKSDQGSDTAITATSTGNDDGHLDGIGKTALSFAADSDPFDASIPAAAVLIGDYDGSAGSTETNADAVISWGPRQAIRVVESGSVRRVYFYPPNTQAFVPRNTGNFDQDRVDVAFWRPLGYFELYGVEIEYTGVRDTGGVGTAYNATQTPFGSTFGRIYADALHAFTHHVRHHKVGPTSDPDSTDDSFSNTNSWFEASSPPDNPLGNFITIQGSGYENIVRGVVGSDDSYTDETGTDKERTSVEIFAMVCVQGFEESTRYVVETQAQFETLGTLANATTGGGQVRILSSATFDRESPAVEPLGYLLGFTGVDSRGRHNSAPLVNQSLRGAIPAAEWGRLPWAVVRATLKDDQTPAVGRFCSLQFNQTDVDANGRSPGSARYLHILTSSIITTPGYDTNALGTT